VQHQIRERLGAPQLGSNGAEQARESAEKANPEGLTCAYDRLDFRSISYYHGEGRSVVRDERRLSTRMVYQLLQRCPNQEALLAMAPEQLGAVLWSILKQIAQQERLPAYEWNCQRTVAQHVFSSQNAHPDLEHAVLEALAWLANIGAIVHGTSTSNGPFFFLTRRGWAVEDRVDLEKLARTALFPRTLLHPVIAQESEAEFRLGKNAAAVFKAFQEVDIRLRELVHQAAPLLKGKSVPAILGKAFEKDGVLAHLRADEKDRDKLKALFQAAMESFRHPTTHERPEIDDGEAVQAIALASYLRRLLD
jgi:hypothetical protein